MPPGSIKLLPPNPDLQKFYNLKENIQILSWHDYCSM